ncbi:lysylphosphatidylglycerol synthase domain-containing protein [Mycoplasmopsis lipofaciens]|uniref:lysylphosphatidylglycerol synthase domain-containing protein n=1 Tax=Mycoplasmopsis lipofaciens TaxID=114884 RepID=UPI000485CD0D|nr:lysylphosphatidylglycerol synthase domain-containing protein [Mycoplasmopsis lipofaciens]
MPINPVFNKWKKNKSNDDNFVNNLLRLNSHNENEINKKFANQLKFINNKIIAQIGVGTDLINEYTITALAYSISDKLLNLNENNKELKVFVAAGMSFHSKLYSSIFARVFYEKGIQPIIFEHSEEYPTTLKWTAVRESNAVACVSMNHYKFHKNIMEISFNWKNGNPFSSSDVLSIGGRLNSINYLALDIPNKPIEYIYSYSFNSYKEQIKKQYCNLKNEFLSENEYGIDISKVKSTEFYDELFNHLNINKYFVKRKKDAHWTNMDNQKYLNKVSFHSMFRKTKANFAISQNGESINLCIKHKKTYKYFKTDEIAALYLNFLLNDDNNFNKNELHKSFIAKSMSIGSLTKYIAIKHNIDVKEFVQDEELWSICEKEPNKKLLFAYTKNNQFVPNNRIDNTYDATHFLFELIRMINFYSTKNITLYDKLQQLYLEYKKRVTNIKLFNIDDETANRFIKRILNAKTIGKYKILNYKKTQSSIITNGNINLKLYFESNDNINIYYNLVDKKIEISSETIAKDNTEEEYLNAIVREREIFDSILELKEEFKVKKLTAWSFLKYFLFILIFVGIFIFLFNSVYNFKNNGTIGKGNFSAIFGKIVDYITYNKKTRIAFLFMCLVPLVYTFFNALILKRLMHFQGEKTKFIDLWIGSFIGIVVQNITPKSIGGDIATYWYLRRRKIARPSLISSIIMNTFVWQIVNIILVVVFVPIGIVFYKDIFSSPSNPSVSIFITFLILGIVIDTTFASLFLFISLSKKMQKFFLKIVLGFFEWLPFIHIYDIENKKAKYEYEIYQVRNGLKKTFKKWYYFVEILFYKLIVWGITPIAIFVKAADIIQPNLVGGWYFNITISGILVRSVNSFSPTPGGTGTADYFFKTLFYIVLKPGKDPIGNLVPEQRISIITAIQTMGTVLIPSIFSLIMLIIVFIGEKRVYVYEAREKNMKLINNKNLIVNYRTKTRFYKIAYTLYTLILVIVSSIFIFI